MNLSGPGSLGQLVIIKLEESRWSAALERMLARYRPAGVLLSSLRSPESAGELLARITRTLDAPPLLWLEEEGGDADPLAALFPPLPSPGLVAGRGLSAVERLGQLIGAAMRLLGFNADCAPTLDLAISSSQKSVAARTLGSGPRKVAETGEAFIRGLSRHRILACGKHFPGARATGDNLASGELVVEKPMTELWREDLVPYRALLPRLSLVMLSDAAYKAYDFELPCPATESTSILEGLLRFKLRYSGLAVADLTRTAEARDGLELAKRVKRTLVAGCDLVIVPADEGSTAAVLAALESISPSAKLETDRLEQSVKRLGSTRKQLARPPGRISAAAVERLAREFEEFGQSIRVCTGGPSGTR